MSAETGDPRPPRRRPVGRPRVLTRARVIETAARMAPGQLTMTRLVGVPPEADTIFEHGLGWNMVRAGSPMHAASREQYIADALPGLRYLLAMIAGRRALPDPGDDFIGTLIATTMDGESLTDMEILALIVALVTAGVDTAVDIHTLALYALLSHPGQRRLLRESPDLIFGAGPHLCIGLNLVKVQAKLMIEEFERRFGDTARLAGDGDGDGDIEYDPMHFNARRMTRLMVATGAEKA